MIVVDRVLISDDIVEKQFVCDLKKCKGGCCEEGDAGAPLTNEELKIMDQVHDTILPYLTEDSKEEIEKKGRYVFHDEFGWVTPTLDSDNDICVYAMRDAKGMIKCAYEQAYYDGLISWKKPISCHLYPIIHQEGKHGDYDLLNYEPREQLCSPACSFGEKLKVPVYEFLKEPLIRLYGEQFYEALDAVGKEYVNLKK